MNINQLALWLYAILIQFLEFNLCDFYIYIHLIIDWTFWFLVTFCPIIYNLMKSCV